MTVPTLVMFSSPSLLISYWVWHDGKEIEKLRREIRYFMKKLREK